MKANLEYLRRVSSLPLHSSNLQLSLVLPRGRVDAEGGVEPPPETFMLLFHSFAFHIAILIHLCTNSQRKHPGLCRRIFMRVNKGEKGFGFGFFLFTSLCPIESGQATVGVRVNINY